MRIGDELIYFGSSGGGGRSFIPCGAESVVTDKFCPHNGSGCNGCGHTVQTVNLTGCVRGVLGTEAEQHGAGARIIFYEAFPITRLTDALGQGEDRLSLHDATHFPDEGYAFIGGAKLTPYQGEIVGWTRAARGGRGAFEGCEHFRGRYGTARRLGLSHRSGDLVINLPFRYWDRYAAEEPDAADLAYFSASYAARGAEWRTIEWATSDFDRGVPTDDIELVVLVRFDAAPAWSERPTNRAGGIWQFKGAGVEHAFRGMGGPLIADSIEVRAFFSYGSGAYDENSNNWKRNIRLDNMIVTFGSPFIVRKVDLLDY
jgi:hypothetical protein